MAKHSRLLIFLVFLIDACIDPINFKIPAGSLQLVVEGMITNEPGPYQVNLTRSYGVDDYYFYEFPYPEKGAQITLKDDLGNSELFSEVDKGVYETGGIIQGTIGRSYHIEIITTDGKQYESIPDLMKPAGAIDSLYFRYVDELEVIDGITRPKRGFDVFLDAQGDPSVQNFIRWRWTGTYKIFTHPELRLACGDSGCFPDPFPCSGYIVGPGGIIANSECTCCTCWVNQFPTRPVLADEQFVSNGQFRNINIAYVPVTGELFYDKYHIEVEQVNMSGVTYNFWKTIRSQIDGASSLFQPPTARINGNIFQVANGEKAMGIFYATGISRKSMFIYNSDVPGGVPLISTIVAPCTRYDSTATTVTPPFWQ